VESDKVVYSIRRSKGCRHEDKREKDRGYEGLRERTTYEYNGEWR